jgi:hypothetical protein
MESLKRGPYSSDHCLNFNQEWKGGISVRLPRRGMPFGPGGALTPSGNDFRPDRIHWTTTTIRKAASATFTVGDSMTADAASDNQKGTGCSKRSRGSEIYLEKQPVTFVTVLQQPIRP